MRSSLLLITCVGFLTGAVAQNTIVGWEAYYDPTIAPGAGTWYPVTNNDTVDIIGQLDASTLSQGFHHVYVRMKASTGLWSSPVASLVYVQAAAPTAIVHEVVACEYYVGDTDPGPGFGTPIPLDSAESEVYIQRELHLLSLALPNGDYHINIRFKSSSGYWSMIERRQFSVCDTWGALAGFDIYRSGSSVSFVDQSQYATSIYYDYGDGQTDTVWNPFHAYDSPGNYTVIQIATNACAQDTMVRVAQLSGLTTYHPHVGGNAGYCTIALIGVNFSSAMTFRLFRAGSSDLAPDSIYLHSSSSATCMLNLLDQDTGYWDLELILPGDTSVTIPNGFRIVDAPKSSMITVNISHPGQLRSNTWATYTIDVQNQSMNDAFGVPLWFAYTSDLTVEYETLIETPVFPGSDTLPAILPIDSLYNRPFAGNVRALIVPHIPGSSSYIVTVKVKSSLAAGMAELTAWTMPPMLGLLGDTASVGQTHQLRSLAGVAECISCFIEAPLNCILGFSNLMIKPFVDQQKGQKTATLDYIQIMIETVRDCGTTALMILAPELAIVKVLGEVDKLICILQKCLPPVPPPPLPVPVGCACDPNEKYGQRGFAPEGYLAPDGAMSYQIAFENADTSMFSAQRISIIDTLDALTLNIHQATLHDIGVGDSVYYIEPESRSFARVIPLTDGYELRLNADIDTITGVAHWDFFVADTVDHELPLNPLVGFLPPNLSSPEGQGFVTFRIPMKEGLPHEQTIVNQASIIFDNNEAIVTEPWLNTIDALPPWSNVHSLPAFTEDTVVIVSWGGDDSNSGIQYYEVYASADTIAGYDLWTISGDTSGAFVGQDMVTYHFYSIAVDSVGNREVKAPTSEAQTQIDFSTEVDMITPEMTLGLSPNPTTGSLTLRGRTTASCALRLEVMNAFGQVLVDRTFASASGLIRTTIDISDLADGAYIARVTCNETRLVERVIRVSE